MEVKDFVAEDFLELVWGEREGWVDLPAKIGGYWVPFHTSWPADGAVSRRIDSALRDREDLYYSVAQFAERGRKIEDVLPASWLWADLDEVHPTVASKLGLHPTLAVESSPGRYQALWRLSRELSPKGLAKLNRALSYALDADRGGWDLTQVLRIPGTRNFKYPEAPIVKLLWYAEDTEYDPKKVWAIVKQLVPEEDLERAVSITLPKRALPSRLKRLLHTGIEQVVEGERSNRLWELECGLAECGWAEDEIFGAVWNCAWNKWRGVNSGQARLKREIHKAVLHVSRKAALKRTHQEERDGEKEQRENRQEDTDRTGQDSDGTRSVVDRQLRDIDGASDEPREDNEPDGSERALSRLPFVGYSSFLAMRMEQPKWMVEGIWTAASHGIIGGEPKTAKTTLALALGLAVASGRPFLGEFPVHTSGPVLMVQEENAPWMMQDRMRKIANLYGLISKDEVVVNRASVGGLGKTTLDIDFGADVPFRLLNNFGFDLSIEEHRDLLVGAVEAEKPALLILDPLYMMVGAVNYDKAHEMVRFLKWLLRLRYEFNMAVVVVHHFGKQAQGPSVGNARRTGQRLLGSTIFHGWTDCALYASQGESERDGWTRSRVEREFRSMAPQKPFDIDLWMADPGSLKMSVEVQQRTLMGLILEIVRQEPGVTLNQLAQSLNKDKRTLLARIRGDEKERFKVEEGKRGRGNSHRIFLAEETDA